MELEIKAKMLHVDITKHVSRHIKNAYSSCILSSLPPPTKKTNIRPAAPQFLSAIDLFKLNLSMVMISYNHQNWFLKS